MAPGTQGHKGKRLCLPRLQASALFHLLIHQLEWPFCCGCVEHLVGDNLSGLPTGVVQTRTLESKIRRLPQGPSHWSGVVFCLKRRC